MINLSDAKAGDWYSYGSHGVAKLVALGTEEACFIFEDNTGFLVTDLNGRDSSGHPVVASKIDPRTWLKDMPDAGIFSEDVCSVHMSETGSWFYTRKSDSDNYGDNYNYDICNAIKMPALTGDQWKDSLISIDKLREWQEVNK